MSYSREYKKWLDNKGVKVPNNLVHIIFNRISFSGEETPIMRLAAIMHEPYHALEILQAGNQEHKLVLKAFNDFTSTKFGKQVWENY